MAKAKRVAPISKENLRKYWDKLRVKIEYYARDLSNYHVCITAGNSKIGKTWNVSLAPLESCGNCSHCAPWCYDIKSGIQYGNVLNARARNQALVTYDRERYFAEIDKFLSSNRKHKVFRWHVGGEIPDYDYLCRMIELARKHSDWQMWTYTKMYPLVNLYVDLHGMNKDIAIPANLSIMFSEWKGMEMYNPYGFGVFRCIMPDETFPENLYKCPGKCQLCINAGRGCPVNESVGNDLHG